MIEKDLFEIKAELQQNQNHLNDVRDAQKALAQEWDRLQAERQLLIAKAALAKTVEPYPVIERPDAAQLNRTIQHG
jgi:phage shock protein A